MMYQLYGLVLCGGKSSRMQTDKSLLDYHGLPQWKHIYNLLSAVCSKVYISCNSLQAGMFENYPVIADNYIYNDAGPMTGLLSAFHSNKVAYFVVACDYPFISSSEIRMLADSRDISRHATACFNTFHMLYEPLIAIYESSAEDILVAGYHAKRFSLLHFLNENNTASVTLPVTSIHGVNTLEEYISARETIQSMKL